MDSHTATVINITETGFYMTVDGEGFFLSFESYPWFDNAPVRSIFNVQFTHGYHLHWPALDVDLELDALRHPENYPLHYTPPAEVCPNCSAEATPGSRTHFSKCPSCGIIYTIRYETGEEENQW